ncbi:MAG: anti-sigma factor [Thermomicrobiales bacterium]
MNGLPEFPTSEISELLAAYALGALEPDERDFVARNLPRFPEWQKELDEYRLAATALAHAAEPVDVPLRVRAGVLSEVDAIESNVPLQRYRKAAWNATIPPTALPIAEPPERRNWKRTIPRVALITSMPATIVAIVFAMYTVIIHDQITEQQNELAEFQQVQDESAEVFTSPSTERQVIDLVASNDAPFARGSLFVDKSENAAVLVARSLPSLAESEQFVVWVQTGNNNEEYARIGVLEPNDAGTAQIIIDPPDLFDRYTNVLVTRESEVDSTSPAGAPILSAGI